MTLCASSVMGKDVNHSTLRLAMLVRYYPKRVVKNVTDSSIEDLLLVSMGIKGLVFILSCCKAVNGDWINVKGGIIPYGTMPLSRFFVAVQGIDQYVS